MKVWLTRDEVERKKEVAIFRYKPGMGEDGPGVWSAKNTGSLVTEFPVAGFKRSFGFTPRKGSCKQYELELKEIKE